MDARLKLNGCRMIAGRLIDVSVGMPSRQRGTEMEKMAIEHRLLVGESWPDGPAEGMQGDTMDAGRTSSLRPR